MPRTPWLFTLHPPGWDNVPVEVLFLPLSSPIDGSYFEPMGEFVARVRSGISGADDESYRVVALAGYAERKHLEERLRQAFSRCPQCPGREQCQAPSRRRTANSLAPRQQLLRCGLNALLFVLFDDDESSIILCGPREGRTFSRRYRCLLPSMARKRGVLAKTMETLQSIQEARSEATKLLEHKLLRNIVFGRIVARAQELNVDPLVIFYKYVKTCFAGIALEPHRATRKRKTLTLPLYWLRSRAIGLLAAKLGPGVAIAMLPDAELITTAAGVWLCRQQQAAGQRLCRQCSPARVGVSDELAELVDRIVAEVETSPARASILRACRHKALHVCGISALVDRLRVDLEAKLRAQGLPDHEIEIVLAWLCAGVSDALGRSPRARDCLGDEAEIPLPPEIAEQLAELRARAWDAVLGSVSGESSRPTSLHAELVEVIVTWVRDAVSADLGRVGASGLRELQFQGLGPSLLNPIRERFLLVVDVIYYFLWKARQDGGAAPAGNLLLERAEAAIDNAAKAGKLGKRAAAKLTRQLYSSAPDARALVERFEFEKAFADFQVALDSQVCCEEQGDCTWSELTLAQCWNYLTEEKSGPRIPKKAVDVEDVPHTCISMMVPLAETTKTLEI
jgi:hypothetical protein